MMSTNIKISGNKVIFDGHASNDRECKTITNICNALKDSDSFETKEYRRGYAEFESVTEPEKKLFGEEPGSVTINFDSHVRKVTCTYGTYTKSGQTISDDYMFGYCTFRVYCDDGYIIDMVTSSDSGYWAEEITEYTFYGTGDYSSFNSGPTFTITTKQSTTTTKYKAERMYGDSELQESITVTPTTSNQTVKLDSDKIAVKTVKVNKIPSNYIAPSGTLEITENGETNVKNYAKVNVNVETNDGVALTAASNESFASLLTAENEGKIVKYTGTTSEDYVAGEYYLIKEEE